MRDPLEIPNLPAEILPGGWAGDDNDLDLYFDTLDEMEEDNDEA